MDAETLSDEGTDGHGLHRPPLNLRQIEVFRAIMVSGSISGAGRALHVSQPALSRVLALTEARLGYRLFERVKSRLAPTLEARRLYIEVERLYGGIQRVNDLAASLGQSGAGTLKVVASASFGQHLIPLTLMRFRQRNVEARIDFRSVTFDELTSHFLSAQADIGISMSPPDHPDLISECIARVPVVCALPAAHPLTQKTVIVPEDFAAGPWIGYPANTPLGTALNGFFGATHSVAAAIEVHSPVTACAFVQRGLGPAFVDAWCLTPEMSDHIAVRPISPVTAIEIWATYSKLQPLPMLGRRFLAAIKTTLRQEAPSNFVGEL